ncbi:MAG: hypothetical protein ACSHWY_01215 [Octadecabacter sp.]
MSLTENLADASAIAADLVDKHKSITRARLVFHTLDGLRADDDLTGNLLDGALVDVLLPLPCTFEKVSSGTVHVTSASGANFRLSMDTSCPLHLEATGDGVTNDTVELDQVQADTSKQIDLAGRDYRYIGVFAPAKPVFNGRVIDDDETHDYQFLTEDRLATSQEAALGLPADKVVRLEDVATIVATLVSTQIARNIVQTAFTGTNIYSSAIDHDLSELDTTLVVGSAGSKVRVSFSVSYECDHDAVFYITRNGVELYTNDAASPGSRQVGVAPALYDSGVGSTMSHQSIELIDTPPSPGNNTYRLHLRGQSTALAINRTLYDDDANHYERASSFCILEELRA